MSQGNRKSKLFRLALAIVPALVVAGFFAFANPIPNKADKGSFDMISEKKNFKINEVPEKEESSMEETIVNEQSPVDYKFNLANGITVQFSDEAKTGPSFAIADAASTNILQLSLMADETETSSSAGFTPMVNGNVLEYPLIIKDIPLLFRYTVSENMVKEEMIIDQKPSSEILSALGNALFIPFALQTQGFTAFQEDGQYVFTSSDSAISWKMPSPTIEDAFGNKGSITGTLKDSLYTLIISAEFLAQAVYPVTIDPSVIVSGTIAETEALQGGIQRKIVFVNGNWYAFYEDGSDVFYKKSSDGITWGAAVDVDTADAANYKPSVWVEGNTIYVAWTNGTGDDFEVNTINTASSDALGTKCTSAFTGAWDTADFVSIAVADDGTVYLANDDTPTVAKLTFVGCTFTDITSGSGLTTSDKPVLTTIGNNLHMVFQDGDLTHMVYNGTSWTTVEGSFTEAEAQFGGLQRKIVYASSNWYAFYTDDNDVFYKKSSDGVTWGSAVDVDATDADNFNPTVWLEGTLIYVAWIDNTTDNIEVNTINTASGDALGTQCTSTDQGSLDTTNVVSIAVADDGTVYTAYSDSSTDYEVAVFKLTFSGCTFTDITTGSGLTAGDMPVLTTIGNNLHMVFQDGNISHSVYDGSNWTTSNTTIDSDTDNIYSLTTDATNLWLLTVDSATAAAFYKYNGSVWSSETSPWASQTNLTSVSLTYATSTNDLYAFVIQDTSEQAYYSSSSAASISWSSQTSFGFTAGDLGHISSPQEGAGASQIGVSLRQGIDYEFGSLTPSVANIIDNVTNIDADTDNIYSLTTDGTNLWLLTVDASTSAAFYQCTSPANDPVWTSLISPWTGQTNLTSVSLTYATSTNDLYAFVIQDTSEQAYFSSSSAASIAWSSQTSFGFTAGDLGHISSPQQVAGTSQIGVSLRQGIDYEFGSLTPSVANIIDNVTNIDADTDNIYSLTTDGTSLWLLTVDDTASAAFYQCTSPANDPVWTSLTSPWTGQTNLTSVSLTYATSTNDLYAFVIQDTSEQAYFSSSPAAAISWSGSGTSFGFTAGDLGHISSPQEGAGTSQIGVTVRQGVNLEFAIAFLAPPTVTTQGASAVEETTATFNGNIDDTGGENAGGRVFNWGITSGVYTSTSTEYGSWPAGAFTYNATGLTKGEAYYYRAYATNTAGTGYGTEVSFITKPDEPTGLSVTAKTNSSISLSWSKGTGAQNTLIRYRIDQYPASPTDGTQAYLDSGTSYDVTSLSNGQIYYFRAWSSTTDGGLSTTSDLTSDITDYTNPGDPSGLNASNPTETTIDLSWAKGTGGDKTMIRRKVVSYPTSYSDGDQAYFDTAEIYTDTSVSCGNTYYYRAWAYDSDSGYYSDSNLVQDTETTTACAVGEIRTGGAIKGGQLQLKGSNLKIK